MATVEIPTTPHNIFPAEREIYYPLIAEFYRESYRNFFKYFLKGINNSHLPIDEAERTAEDLINDTFSRAVEHIDGEKAKRLKMWIGKIARNRLKEHYRAKDDYLDFSRITRFRDRPGSYSLEDLNQLLERYGHSPHLKVYRSQRDIIRDGRYPGNLEHMLIEDEVHDLLIRAVNKLPRNSRNAIILFYFKELSYAEIADATERNIITVRTDALRGKRKLQEMLNSYISKKSQQGRFWNGK